MPSLGLAMIVKNGATTLGNCIASVSGVTDQIVIADTGSSDGTVQLARDLGAEVFDFPWQDDFAQARNAAVQALTTDWVLVMDDDEELDPEAREKIPALLNNPTVGGYLVTLRNYIFFRFGVGAHGPSAQPLHSAVPHAGPARAYTDFALCRLFRRNPHIYYVNRVHELVEPCMHALGLDLVPANFVIHHFGHLCSPEELRAKDELYRKLSRLKVKDAPNDSQSWTELGQLEYERFKNYSVAIECFERAMALQNCSNIPYLSLASLYLEIQDDERALQVLSRVLMKGRAAGMKKHLCGDAFYNLGRLKEARSEYIAALRILPEDAVIASKLGLTEVRLGMKKHGFARLTRALKTHPEILEMHDRLIKACILMNMMPQAADAADRMALEFASPATMLRAVSIRARMKDWNAAANVLHRGLGLFPQNSELLRARSELARETPLAARIVACRRDGVNRISFRIPCREQLASAASYLWFS
jgi:glycosyltransferase involved in cell wall biosynthesis